METRSRQAIVPVCGWKESRINLQNGDVFMPFRGWDDGGTDMQDGDERTHSLGWTDSHTDIQNGDSDIAHSLRWTDSQKDYQNGDTTSCDDLASGASSASFQCDLQSSVDDLPQAEARHRPHVSSNPNPAPDPHFRVNVSQVRIRSIDYSRNEVLRVSTSEVSVQQIVTASTSTQVRPLPRPPTDCRSRMIQVDTSEDHCGMLSCCKRRKYYKVAKPRPGGRNNMAWMLRRKTLLTFSTLSMVLALLSCGLLLVLQFWETLVGRAENFCVASSEHINSTRDDLQNRTATDCQSQIQQVIESLAVTGNEVSRDKTCSVHVPRGGWFFIYSSVRVNMSRCPPDKKHWQHKIVLVTRNQTLTNQTLAMAVRTCCDDCPEYVETSFTGAIYRLETGDQLTVFLDLPNTAPNQTCIDTIFVG